MLAALIALLATASPALAQDSSIDDLLSNIPDIETKEQEQEQPDVPDVPFTQYIDEVRAKVLAEWKPKKGTIKKNPGIETRLALEISETGEVTDLNAMVLSGDKKYDQSCVDAVNDAGDMPAPAPNLVSLAKEGVIVVFSGKEYQRGK